MAKGGGGDVQLGTADNDTFRGAINNVNVCVGIILTSWWT
jgi:hypothetical protein